MIKRYARSLVAAIGMGLCAVVAPASAAEYDPGFYLGFGFGKFNDDNNNTAYTAKRSNNSTHRYAVGYNFNDYVSAEGGFVDFKPADFDTNTGGQMKFDAKSTYVMGIGQFPLSVKDKQMVAIYGEGGMHRFNAQEKLLDSLGNTTSVTKKTGNAGVWGVGALVRGKNAAFRAGMNKYLGFEGSGSTEHDFTVYHLEFMLFL